MIIVVSGTPGVGKSSIAEKLSEKIQDSRHVDVSDLVKKESLHRRMDKSRQTLVADKKRLGAAITRMIKDSRVKIWIISTHYIGGHLPKEEIRRCFVLRLNPLQLEQRLVSRRWSSAKVRENVEAELVGVCLYEAVGYLGKRNVHDLDTTGKTEQEIVKEILGILDGSRKHREHTRPGSVDWLQSYDFRTLKEFRATGR